MAVLVLGGYGLIGSALVERLIADGVPVVGLGRHTAAARLRWPGATWRDADLSTLVTPLAWAPLLIGVDVVVNAAGVLQRGLRDDVDKVQLQAMRALYAAAGPAGLRRIVQVSAAGASPTSPLEFFRTKGQADEALRASGIEHVILRPGLVMSPISYGGTGLLRALAAFPAVTPLVSPDSPIQTVWIDDLAEVVAVAASGGVASGVTLDVVETPRRTLAETVRLMRAWLGLPAAPTLGFPPILSFLVGVAADALGWLGWRPPLRSTAMAVVREGVVGDAEAVTALLGRPPKALPETLRIMPSGVQELWFARLWLLKPVVLGGLAAFWMASGLIGLVRWRSAADILTTHRVSDDLAIMAAVAGAILDLLLGCAILIRPAARAALRGMALTSLAYMAGAAILAPGLWADPLGPMVKVVPVVLLTLVGLAILDER